MKIDDYQSEWINPETWRRKPEHRKENNGYGMCNTGARVKLICSLGGIGCNVDHAFVKAENLAAEVNALRRRSS